MALNCQRIVIWQIHIKKFCLVWNECNRYTLISGIGILPIYTSRVQFQKKKRIKALVLAG